LLEMPNNMPKQRGVQARSYYARSIIYTVVGILHPRLLLLLLLHRDEHAAVPKHARDAAVATGTAGKQRRFGPVGVSPNKRYAQ
jgi:hypothetical protein